MGFGRPSWGPLALAGVLAACSGTALDKSGGGGAGGAAAGISGQGVAGEAAPDGAGGAGGVQGLDRCATGGAGGSAPGEHCTYNLPDNCGAALCGNGVLDSCTITDGGGLFCTSTQFTEACDGNNLGSRTCLTEGWGSGMLTCDSSCRVNAEQCSECPEGQSCVDIPFKTASVAAFALQATSSTIGVAWVDAEFTTTHTMHLARLSPSLGMLGVTDYVESAASDATITMVPTGSGWLIAGYLDPEIFVRAVNNEGQTIARFKVDSVPPDVFARGLVLAAQPGGGPLLVWNTTDGLRGAMIAADGASASAPRDLMPVTVESPKTSVVFIKGAFYVLEVLGHASTPDATSHLIRVATDGTPGAAVDVMPGVSAPDASAYAAGNELRVIYQGRSPCPGSQSESAVMAQRLDLQGSALGGPILLGDPDWNFGDGAYTSLGADEIVLWPAPFSFLRVASNGSVTGPSAPLLKMPSEGWPQNVAVTSVGSQIVVGWSGRGGGIRLMRVTP
jgi:hypothetical protein